MIVFYRLSDGSYPKERFEAATKENCLLNFFDKFVFTYGVSYEDQFVLVADNVKDETVDWLNMVLKNYIWKGQKNPPTLMRTQGGSSAAGFRIVFEEALKLADDEYVYFVEDDYCHIHGSRKVMLEGLERSHYVTLYNHPDKYIPASKGGNPLIGDDAAEETKVFVTEGSYWMLTNSTTMTFATRVGILREDEAVWRKYTEGSYPQDMKIFLELRDNGRTLIQPIPTMATHCEPAWAAHKHGTGVGNWNMILDPKNIVKWARKKS